ncbi:P-loop containing nucleoside triphosphate hydrolase protein [Abortiporus biennis]|nr:P-loop containing nucleoside triphosphate hydrolase protein [Abortiporus biennis]
MESEDPMQKAYELLRNTYKFESFRANQEAAIQRLLVDGKRCLLIFVISAGKSLLYQIPAFCLDRLDSTLCTEEYNRIKAEILNGGIQLLFVCPERLCNESFVEMMKRVPISLLAIDEAHCISQWGQTFHPDYLKIARFAEELNVQRSAGALSHRYGDKICGRRHLHLQFRIELANNFDEKLDKLVPMLRTRNGPAIIYVALQKQTHEVAEKLSKHVQNKFMQSDNGIMCATIAFGMGIDKANIRQVVHLYMTKSLENYSQEVGRAGRYGEPSECVMFLCDDDIPILRTFASDDTCREESIKSWLHQVAQAAPAVDGTISFTGTQFKDLGIHISGVTTWNFLDPFFSVYDITPLHNGLSAVRADSTREAMIVRRCWYLRPIAHRYIIDIAQAAAAYAVDRNDLAKKISEWEFYGSEAIDQLAEDLQRMVKREHDAVRGIWKVIRSWRGLRDNRNVPARPPCPERDEPYLLAQLAFGIESTQLDARKWSKSHPLFGSMMDYDYDALVSEFTQKCEKAGYRPAAVIQDAISSGTSSTRKRSHSSYSDEEDEDFDSSDTPHRDQPKRRRLDGD